MNPASPSTPVLQVRHLSTCFKTAQGIVTAVDDVSFDLYPGETLGIVGESGCGKTVTSKSILRLLPEGQGFIKPGSEIWFGGVNLAAAGEKILRAIRGARIAMIFQEPMTALNPVFTIGWQIEEALQYHSKLPRRERRRRAVEMLRLVEIPNPEQRVKEYPHQLSGGMRQRVMIAIALCCEPDILIADEPTTALDVTIQAQILQLLEGLRRKLNTSVILITHNLGVVAQVCDRVLVMYAGRIVESGSVFDIFHRPQHPYTQALLQSLPRAGKKQPVETRPRRLPAIPGIVPSLLDLPRGCRFHDRCPCKQDRCAEEEPRLLEGPDAREVRCHYPIGPAPAAAERGA